jgi:hypothetical protein
MALSDNSLRHIPVGWTRSMTQWLTRAITFSLIVFALEHDDAPRLDAPTGRIVETVIFTEKNFPKPTIIANDKETSACGAPTLDVLISKESRGIPNVVLRLEDVKIPEGYKPPRQDLSLIVQQCQFRPRVVAMTVGSTIKEHELEIAVTKGATTQVELSYPPEKPKPQTTRAKQTD